MRNIDEKVPEWEIIDLQDGRFALNRHGSTVFVGHSYEEVRAWHAKRFPAKHDEDRGKALKRAIGRI